jgi:hypothetical protein
VVESRAEARVIVSREVASRSRCDAPVFSADLRAAASGSNESFDDALAVVRFDRLLLPVAASSRAGRASAGPLTSGAVGDPARSSSPPARRESDPLATRESAPLTPRESDPLTPRESDLLALPAPDPLALRESDLLTLRESDPLATRESNSLGLRASDRLALRASDPLTLTCGAVAEGAVAEASNP